jgi:hypothetical protein
MRAHFTGNLQAIVKAAASELYPANPTGPTKGWGSIHDDEDVVNELSRAQFQPIAPKILPATADLPDRLRLRYYYDERDSRLTRVRGTAASWQDIHYRRAIDFIIFDGDQKDGFPILAAIRHEATFNKIAVGAIKSLEHQVLVESDVIPETLSPDFYQWLLLRLHHGGALAAGIQLDQINEMSAADRLVKRGARFSNDAPLDRADLAALLAIGNSSFGPAKLALASTKLDAFFILELHLDGGFAVYRTSTYGSTSYTTQALGSALFEDLWWVVLPAVRVAYNSDSVWRKDGIPKLKILALANLAAALDCTITPNNP